MSFRNWSEILWIEAIASNCPGIWNECTRIASELDKRIPVISNRSRPSMLLFKCNCDRCAHNQFIQFVLKLALISIVCPCIRSVDVWNRPYDTHDIAMIWSVQFYFAFRAFDLISCDFSFFTLHWSLSLHVIHTLLTILIRNYTHCLCVCLTANSPSRNPNRELRNINDAVWYFKHVANETIMGRNTHLVETSLAFGTRICAPLFCCV